MVRMTLVLAHRGAHATATENTVAAFTEAFRLGADGVELDIRRTRDDVVVCHHDDTVPGYGPLTALARSALPPHIPTLDEALDACAGYLVNIEVKRVAAMAAGPPDHTTRLLLQVLAARRSRKDDVVVSSFAIEPLDEVVAAGGIHTAWLTAIRPEGMDLAAPARARGYTGIHPLVDLVTPDFVTQAHAVGLPVRVWTVNDPARIAWLASIGVDAVITDDVVAARSALGR
jgi:glycerophosphoryl diester phosphodiesterase